MERTSGVLLHISSLPNNYGIGSFGQSAYDFVDFLVETGQKYWQILPLTTTSFGDSPYQSFSAFAGNTNFIDFDQLIEGGFLKKADFKNVDFGDNPVKVNYEKIFNQRRPLLEKAVGNFISQKGLELKDFKAFVSENEDWLWPFVEYMTVKEGHGLKAWYEWPKEFRAYDEKKMQAYCYENEDRMNYHLVTQYWFSEQWSKLKDYVNAQNILIIGDIPIYVARDSVEMWTTPEMFKVDKQGNPLAVAGVPPDSFSEDGQYWGNPIYDWEYMDNNNYDWWIKRMRESFELYDMVRIDHFRGFESYWEVPFGSETAASGKWKKGPAGRLFKQIKKELGDINVIAEDLGFVTDEVIEMREETGFPGMKILQNGFYGEDNLDLPHHYDPNTIAYVGTHDNPTALDWNLNFADADERDSADLYLNRRPGEHVSDALNRGIAASPSKIAIYVMQDLLRLGEEGRMNIPSTIGDNWDWRMTSKAITTDLEEKLLQWTETYFRMNEVLLEEPDEAEEFETEEELKEETETEEKVEENEVLKETKNSKGEKYD
jgi:4-alpha-glucanotransferase